MDQSLRGWLAGVVAVAVVAAGLLPLRSHIAIATTALVLVVPVVLGAAMGGWSGGVATVLAGFLVYDFVFIPPYYTLTVGSWQDWAVLAVYGAVMLVVARLVAHLRQARASAESRLMRSRRLLDITELLLADGGMAPDALTKAVQEGFDVGGVALLEPFNGRLVVMGQAGVPLSAEELSNLRNEGSFPLPFSTRSSASNLQAVALISSGRPVGLLVLRDAPSSAAAREAFQLLAHHLAIALERDQLQGRARQAELLEEIDRLRETLIGAVSHDLRSPLATIKVAISTLAEPEYRLTTAEKKELYELVELQTDRLTRLVSNLLDMTRIRAGALELHPQWVTVGEIVAEAEAALGASLDGRKIELSEGSAVLLIYADPTFVSQALANLLDNANRHAPGGHPVVIDAAAIETTVEISVSDDGPGIPTYEREAIFQTFVRFDTGGRSGLGLAIAKAFVEAHGGHIWAAESDLGGARFSFSIPVKGAPG